MIQIISISEARNSLASLIQKVKETKQPVVIVQDSTPSVVLYPYEDMVKRDEVNEQLFRLRFQKVFREGEKTFGAYIKKNKKKVPKTEEQAYSIIKNA